MRKVLVLSPGVVAAEGWLHGRPASRISTTRPTARSLGKTCAAAIREGRLRPIPRLGRAFDAAGWCEHPRRCDYELSSRLRSRW